MTDDAGPKVPREGADILDLAEARIVLGLVDLAVIATGSSPVG